MHKSEIVRRNGFEANLFVPNDKIAMSKSPYSAFSSTESDELVFKGSLSYVNVEKIVLHSQMRILRIIDEDTLDLDILKALYELDFANSRMITLYLNIIGIDIHQKKIARRLDYLTRIKAVSAYEFRSIDENGMERSSHTPIWFLDSASKFIFKSQNMPFDKMDLSLKSKDGIKEALSRNQLLLTYVQNINNILFTKNRPTFKLGNGDILNPSLLMVFENNNQKDYMLFEFVRSYQGWESKLLMQLDRYKNFIEGFTPSATIPQLPYVILVAENDMHAANIAKLVLTNDLMPENKQHFFSTDNRVRTMAKNNSGLFKCSPSDKEIKLVLLNIGLFEM